MRRALIVSALVVVASLPLRGEILEQILVKVNGEIVTKTDLEQRQIQVLRARNRAVSADDLKNDEALRRTLEEITPQIVVDTVDEMLILQQGKERGYRMSDDQFKGILERIRKENRLDTEEAFQNALKQEGLTLAELRTQMERQMIVSRVQSDAVGKVGVSEEEERAYYDQHAGEFTTPASLTLREVLVAVPESTVPGPAGVAQPAVNVAADEEAQQKAEAIRARAAAGEDFAQIAAAESDAASKANGGLIGPLNLDELTPGLRPLIEALKPGEYTRPVRTARGYQVFKLESLTPATVLPFDQAREQIANKIYGQKRQVEFRKYMVKLRSQAIIEWKNDELRKMYEAQVAKVAPETPSL